MPTTGQGFASKPQFRLLSVIRALWKRKLSIAVLTLVGAGATVAVVSKLRPVYTAEALILVESQKVPENFVAATVQTALDARLDMLKRQVLSHDRLWSLVEALDLYPDEKRKLSKEEVVEIMRGDIGIDLSRGWNTSGPGAFRVEYRAPKAAIAAEVANRVGMFFINENLRQRTVEAQGTSEFLDSQLRESEHRLRQQEAKLKEFKLTYNGELPQQEGALLAAMSQSRAELLGTQEGLSRAQQNKLILESSLAYGKANLRELEDAAQRRAERQSTPAPAAGAPAPPSELDLARAQLSRLRARYYDSHPEVQQALLEVQRLERQPRERAAARVAEESGSSMPAAQTAPGGATAVFNADEVVRSERNRIQELTAQIALVKEDIRNLESRRQRLLAELGEAQQRLLAIPVREQQLASITRDYETSKANYESLLNKKLAADVAAQMERWQKSQKFVMLDPARVPLKPTRPRRMLLIATGCLFSLLTASAIAFLLELKKNVVLGEWELPPNTTIVGRIPPMQAADL